MQARVPYRTVPPEPTGGLGGEGGGAFIHQKGRQYRKICGKSFIVAAPVAPPRDVD